MLSIKKTKILFEISYFFETEVSQNWDFWSKFSVFKDSSAPPDQKEVPRSQQNDDSAPVPSAPAAEQGGSSEQVVATPPQITAADAPPGTPPGLEYLALLDQVLVQQQVELVEGNWK